jgi:hypothetical protein
VEDAEEAGREAVGAGGEAGAGATNAKEYGSSPIDVGEVEEEEDEQEDE